MSGSGYTLVARADPWRDPRRVVALLAHLTRRHLAARYRGTTLGFAWSLLHPLLHMAVYTFLFSVVLRVAEPGVPYPAFFLTGLLGWSFFRTALANATSSVVDAAPLLHKTAFPRVLLPLSAVAANGLHYLAAVPLLVAFNAAYGIPPGPSLLRFAAAFALWVGLAAACGLWLAALQPFFRDVAQLLDAVLMAGLFASPVLYPSSRALEALPEPLAWVYQANPLVGVLELTRSAFLGTSPPAGPLIGSVVTTLLLLAGGRAFFARRAPRFTEAC